MACNRFNSVDEMYTILFAFLLFLSISHFVMKQIVYDFISSPKLILFFHFHFHSYIWIEWNEITIDWNELNYRNIVLQYTFYSYDDCAVYKCIPYHHVAGYVAVTLSAIEWHVIWWLRSVACYAVCVPLPLMLSNYLQTRNIIALVDDFDVSKVTLLTCDTV